MESSAENKDSVRAGASFLVRLRREGALRFFVRNLQTGEEKHLSDPADLGPYLVRQLGERSTASDDAGRREHSA